jgi:hypothetical protein
MEAVGRRRALRAASPAAAARTPAPTARMAMDGERPDPPDPTDPPDPPDPTGPWGPAGARAGSPPRAGWAPSASGREPLHRLETYRPGPGWSWPHQLRASSSPDACRTETRNGPGPLSSSPQLAPLAAVRISWRRPTVLVDPAHLERPHGRVRAAPDPAGRRVDPPAGQRPDEDRVGAGHLLGLRGPRAGAGRPTRGSRQQQPVGQHRHRQRRPEQSPDPQPLLPGRPVGFPPTRRPAGAAGSRDGSSVCAASCCPDAPGSLRQRGR